MHHVAKLMRVERQRTCRSRRDKATCCRHCFTLCLLTLNSAAVVWCRREMKCSMDGLKFVCSWSGTVSAARISVKVGKLQLEGCSFDGSRLSENMRDSPSISEIPPCTVAWIPKVDDTTSYLVRFFSTYIARCELTGTGRGSWTACYFATLPCSSII